ncbi:hypothetical protein [Taibaiella koreensis]|uniref:hypothetical protein n=1 Tax=Taibaiella koreensis TaxID=1268548 RepID=UPI000E59B9D9|nr:hypothetical protein [Taibaiella koreensis]
MEKRIEVPEFRVRLPDHAIAQLLGISLSDYQVLSHRPIEAYRDVNGEIVEFYIHVSSNNSPRLLDQLNMDHSNFVRFTPKQVYAHYV